MRKLIGLAVLTCLFATSALGKPAHKIHSKKDAGASVEKKSSPQSSNGLLAAIGWSSPVKLPAYDWSRVSLPAIPGLEEMRSPRGNAVDDYLCDVYYRMPAKIDGSGDFTWKDETAAKKAKMDVCQYVIGGMAPGFRQSLYDFGRKADEQEIPWSFLSGYRGEYRQRIATGFKAGPCGSWHGGRQCKEKGYGEGKAADLWTYNADGRPGNSAHLLFAFIDKIGKQFNIFRPMKGGDPAHVQLVRMYDDKPSTYAVVRHNRHKQRYAAKR